MNCPTDLEPAELACPTCGGDGCRACGGDGTFTLDRCARSYFTPDVWSMLLSVDRFRTHHVLPEAGGFLDQTAAFVASLDLIGSDLDLYDAEDAARRRR